MQHKCYAYKKNNCKEPWDKHTLDVIKCIVSRWEFNGLVNKISRMFSIDSKLVNDYIILAGLLHDIAKTFTVYQVRCSESCEYFPKHWIASAYVSLVLANTAGILNYDEAQNRIENLYVKNNVKDITMGDIYIMLVVFPILLHNYAHINEESLFRHHSYIEDIIRSTPKISRECIESIRYVINDIKKHMTTDLGLQILNHIMRYIDEERFDIAVIADDHVLRTAILKFSYNKVKATTEAIIGLLNICDGRVAYENRRRFADDQI